MACQVRGADVRQHRAREEVLVGKEKVLVWAFNIDCHLQCSREHTLYNLVKMT